jgi:putative transcriptional regulator
MEKDLFDELMASVSESGAILRGEREPTRAVRYDASGTATLATPDARAIRDQLKLSRSQFASLIGVSERTVEGWEQGRRHPSGPALTLLRVASRHPESVLDTMRQLSTQ